MQVEITRNSPPRLVRVITKVTEGVIFSQVEITRNSPPRLVRVIAKVTEGVIFSCYLGNEVELGLPKPPNGFGLRLEGCMLL